MARSKHANYFSNPNNRPLVHPFLIDIVFITIDRLYFQRVIGLYNYLLFLGLADTVFYTCLIEDFNEQGVSVPGGSLGVGERGRPINGSSWIADSDVNRKFNPLWSRAQ